MATTIMRDSVVGDQWIRQTQAAVPPQFVVDQKTGQLTGDLLTGPVRLAFTTLYSLPQPKPGNENPKFGSILVFPPATDFALFYAEYYRQCGLKFADKYDAASGQYYGLHSPFRDQAEKLKFGGFTPGCIFLTCTSKFKPPVVDVRGNPVVDPAKVYPGVWAICALNAYTFVDQRKKGVSFGLQSVMLIGDDTPLAGGAPDTNAQYGAVRGALVPPTITPGAVAGMPTGAPPPNAPGMAGPPPGGTYAPPAGPPAGGYKMPGAPLAGPPSQHAGGYGAPPASPPEEDDWSFMN